MKTLQKIIGMVCLIIGVCCPWLLTGSTDSIPPIQIDLLQNAPSEAGYFLLRNDSISFDSIAEIEGTSKENPPKVRRNRRSGRLQSFGNTPTPTSNYPISDPADSISSHGVLNMDCCENLRVNYEDLIHNPPLSETCIITAPDIGGLFYRMPVGTPNGGTVILDNDGNYWYRQHPEGYYFLSWWPEGTIVKPNDTIQSASEALQLILEIGGPGTTIDLTSESSPRTYILDRPVGVLPFTSIIGSGDTLRRLATPLAIAQQSVPSNEQWIYVDNTEGFLKGQNLIVTRGRSHDDVVIGFKKITDIAEDKIKVQGSLGESVETGDTVIVAFSMFINQYGPGLGEIYFEGIQFDGNWRNNPYTNSWSQNNSISILSNQGSRLFVDRCGVYDTPSENFVGATCRITNSQFTRLAGSIYHISVLPDTIMNVFIENCWADSINLVSTEITSHSEAAIVTSALPNNITLSNCDFNNGGEGIVGDLGGNSNYVSIQGGKFRNFKWVVFGGTGDGGPKGGLIANNYFENCGQLEWSNGATGETKAAVDWMINSNYFINTAVDIRGVKGIKISDNYFRYDESLGGFSYLTEANQLQYPAMISFSSVRSLTFSNNTLVGPEAYDPYLQHGILFNSEGSMPNSELFIWERDITIRGNEIRNFHKSISTTPSPLNSDQENSREYYNWVIEDNNIQMLVSNIGGSWGINAAPGVSVFRNHITTAQDTISGTTYPIIAMGIISSTGNPKENQIMGATVIQNTVIGPRNFANDNYSIYVGGIIPLAPGNYYANAVCANNIISTAVASIPGIMNKCMVTSNTLIFPKRKSFHREVPPDF